MTLILPAAARPPSVVITPWSQESILWDLSGEAGAAGAGINSTLAGAWNAVNRAFYVPFYIGAPITVTKLFWNNGGAVAGNIDVGVYDAGGTRLVSTGSTVQAGVSVAQVVDITDLNLNPGAYYMAMASSTVTTQLVFRTNAPPLAAALEGAGVYMQDTAMALPATATWVHTTAAFMPLFGLLRKTTF